MYTKNENKNINEIRSQFKSLKNSCNRTNLYIWALKDEKLDFDRIRSELLEILLLSLEIEGKIRDL